MKPEPVYKTIGAIIRKRRRRLEWPQAKLALRLGISRATLANIETGRQRILVHHLYGLAEILEMKPSDFLPPASMADSSADWATLPIPADLKPQQREQIARLIGFLPNATNKPKENKNGKTAKTLR